MQDEAQGIGEPAYERIDLQAARARTHIKATVEEVLTRRAVAQEGGVQDGMLTLEAMLKAAKTLGIPEVTALAERIERDPEGALAALSAESREEFRSATARLGRGKREPGFMDTDPANFGPSEEAHIPSPPRPEHTPGYSKVRSITGYSGSDGSLKIG